MNTKVPEKYKNSIITAILMKSSEGTKKRRKCVTFANYWNVTIFSRSNETRHTYSSGRNIKIRTRISFR